MVGLCSASSAERATVADDMPDFWKSFGSGSNHGFDANSTPAPNAGSRPPGAVPSLPTGHPHSPSSDDSYGPNAPTAEKRAEAVIRQATGPDYTLEGIRFVERPRRMDDDEDSEDNPQSA